MKELVDLYFKHVEESFMKGSFSKDMYELMFISQLNSYALQFNPIIITPGGIEHPLSLITLVLSGSGSGKDSAIKFLSPLKEKVDIMCRKIFDKKREIVLAKDDADSSKDVAGDGTNFTQAKPKSVKRARKKPLEETLATEHVDWVKSATDAGMNMYYATYSAIGFGAIGLSSTEFGQDFKDRGFRETLEKVLEMWDSPSKVASRITNEKGAIVFEGIQTCCMMHGAFDEFKKNDKMIEDLQTYLSTTMARRALFVKVSEEDNLKFFKFKVEANKKKRDELKNKKFTEEELNETVDVIKTTQYMEELKDKIIFKVLTRHATKFMTYNKFKKNGNLKRPKVEIKFSKGAEIFLHNYQTAMEEEVLKIIESGKISDRRLRIEYQSRHLKAMRIAGMSAFYDGRDVINKEDIIYGVSVVQKSGKYFKDISKPSIIVDDVCECLIGTSEKLTVRDLEDAEAIPQGMTKYRLQDLWERCAEELYQKNMIFRSTMGKSNMIQQVWIERLIETKDDIAHISYSTKENMADVYMDTISVPIYKILDIPSIKKISAGGFKNSSRSNSNVEALGNVLIYDIDDGEMTINQAKIALKGLVGFIYPTKSHRKPKMAKTGKKDSNGKDIKKEKICDRFRIVLLCKQHLPFGLDKDQANEEYKMLYIEIAKHFNIPFDTQTCDMARFFWVTDQSKIQSVRDNGKLNGKNLINLTHFMPMLKINSVIKNSAKKISGKKYWNDMSVKEILERGIKDSIIKGSRNCALFSMSMSLRDKGISYDKITDYILDINDKFNDPLDTKEIEVSILSSLRKRFENGKKTNIN